MRLLEAIRLALSALRAQKLKSFFSLIGVLIGVTFLIAVVSIVQGMNSYMEDRFANTLIGANTFELRQRPFITSGNIPDEVWLAWRRRPRITYADADFVRERIKTPARFAKFCEDRVAVNYGGKLAKDVYLRGTEESYFAIKDYTIAAGRTFSTQEVRSGLPVLVIGGLPYRVIGVVEKQGTLFGLSLDKFAVMPFSAPGRRLICPINILDAFIVQTANPAQMQLALDETEALMRSRRQLKPDQESNFAFQTAEGALGSWEKISSVLMVALPGLVAISLVVGGIVIMNIMLMAVSERTREIGIRKALGARRRDILAQFVVESATLSGVGAVLGIGLGIVLAFVVKAATPLPAAVAPWSIIVAVVLGVTVGIAAGVYPASRASRLDPIAALRAE